MCCILTLCAVLIIVGILFRLFVVDKWFIPDPKSKPILVTGCGAGFGRAFVKKCLEDGLTVFAGCRTNESAVELRKEFSGLGGHLDAFQMDITSDESVRAAREHVSKELKKMGKELHALVNNAGMQSNSFLDDFLTVDDYRGTLEVNTLGTIRTTQYFKPLIKKSRGRIVFCTSSVVRFPAPTMGPYAASKWATTGYVEVLRHELRDFGVIVVSVEPGIFITNLNEMKKIMGMMDNVWERADDATRNEYGDYFFSMAKKLNADMHERAPRDLSPVVNAYMHALFAKYPYRSYTVGWDGYLVFRQFSYLSPHLQELFIQAVRWLKGIPKPAVVA